MQVVAGNCICVLRLYVPAAKRMVAPRGARDIALCSASVLIPLFTFTTGPVRGGSEKATVINFGVTAVSSTVSGADKAAVDCTGVAKSRTNMLPLS